MKTVGLTGGIGSGKSTVARIFSVLGIPVFYSDDVAKSIVNTDDTLKQQIISLLGEESYQDNFYNRKKVADLVFVNKDLLLALNQIIHPAVGVAFEKFIAQNNKADFIIKESALLFETGIYKKCDLTILVTSPIDMRIRNIIKRDGVSENEVLKRMSNQWSDEEKLKLADYVIHNDSSEFLITQAEHIFNSIKLTC